jgi:hypothetical protein
MKVKTLAVIFALTVMGCSSYQSSFEEKPLTIDGSPSDWNTTLNQKGNANYTYGISNDSTNLYLRLNTNDQALQRKIYMAGLTVWIDSTGKREKTLGIACPLAMHSGNKIRQPEDRNSSFRKDQLLEADFIGFHNQTRRYLIAQNPYHVEISISQDEFKSLYYELKIPFASFNQNYTQLAKTPFSICFEIHGIEMPSGPPSKSRQSDMSSNRPMGASGGRSGVGHGGRPGARPDQSTMQDLSSTTRLWIKNIQLAT